MALINLCPHTVNISRGSYSPDSSGGAQRSSSTVYSNVPASIQPASAQMIALYAQNRIKVTHTVYTSQQVSLLNGDLISYGSRTFVVTGIRNLVELGRVYAFDCYEMMA